MKTKILLSFIIILGGFLLFYRFNTLMMFIGDFAWFYLSARDMLLSGHIPLVGITSSHPWLHQGPYWTYLLGIAFWLTHFNPLSGGYLAAGIGVITLVSMYYVGSKMFSQQVGLIASFLYATSPLIIIFSRMPYHTTPIPLFSCWSLYALYKCVKAEMKYFSILLGLFAILYNFELATILLVIAVFIIFLYGIRKKEKWVINLKRKEVIIPSILAVIIPLLPILIYDKTHGFKQTFGFGAWLIYKLFKTPLSLFLPQMRTSQETFLGFLNFLFTSNQRFTFLPNAFIALILFLILLGYFVFLNYKGYKKKKMPTNEVVLSAYGGISFLGFLGMHTVSDAYLPMFFPLITFVYAIVLAEFFKKYQFAVIILLLILTGSNSLALLKNDYLVNKPNGTGVSFERRVEVAQEIVAKAKGRSYTIRGTGNGSQFQTFTMTSEYLTWWLGHGPAEKKEKLQIVTYESPTSLYIKSIKQ